MNLRNEQSIEQIKYVPAGFFLVRVPLLSADHFEALTGGPAGEFGAEPSVLNHVYQMRMGRLEALMRQPLAELALHVASPGLWRSWRDRSTKGLSEQSWHAILRYANRMITRPTPYGLFAGIAVGRFENRTSLALAKTAFSVATALPDMAWLSRVIDSKYDQVLLGQDAKIYSNSLIVDGGHRLTLHLEPADWKKIGGTTISIRKSRLVQQVLRMAKEPIKVSELLRLGTESDEQHSPKLLKMITGLHKLGFLQIDLMPISNAADRCLYVADRIGQPNGDGSVANELREIGTALHDLNMTEPDFSEPEFLRLEQRQRALSAGYDGPTCHVDAALNLSANGLNIEVGEAVADTVSALAAVADHQWVSMRAYAAEFIEHYGLGARVRLMEVLDPQCGIDAPPGYSHPLRQTSVPQAYHEVDKTTRRERVLMSWIQEAILLGEPLELSNERIAELAGGLATSAPPAPALETYVQVQAESAKALDRGDWLAVIGPMGVVPGGRTFGRFWRLLDDGVLQDLRRYVTEVAYRTQDDSVYAELRYAPPNTKLANVNGHPILHDYEIPINVPPQLETARVLHLDDLLIGVEQSDFYIFSQRLQKKIVVTQSHMLSPATGPNACRFLLEISAINQGGVPQLHEPILDSLPFCPRIARGKVVILPACWNVTRRSIDLDKFSGGTFRKAVDDWREKYDVPRYVYLANVDQRLLLDLEDAASLGEFQRTVSKLSDSSLTHGYYQKIQEALPNLSGAWLTNTDGCSYLSEFVIPLRLSSKNAVRSGADPKSRRRIGATNPIPHALRTATPGSEWTYLKLYARTEHHDAIIAGLGHMAQRLGDNKLVGSWHFLRFADPRPHVRARLRTKCPAQNHELLTNVVQWAGNCVDEGLVREFVVETYKPEIERYGGVEGLAIVEEIFHADSAGVAMITSALTRGELNIEPIVIAAFTLHRLLSALGFNNRRQLEQSMLQIKSFKSNEIYRQRGTKLFRLLHSQMADAESVEARALSELFGGGLNACAHMAERLRRLDEQGELNTTWSSITESLAHMHMNRMLGVNRNDEIEGYALLGRSLRSIIAIGAASEKAAPKVEPEACHVYGVE